MTDDIISPRPGSEFASRFYPESAFDFLRCRARLIYFVTHAEARLNA